MWRNDIKCKYMFMFSLKNLARKGLTQLPSQSSPTFPVCILYHFSTLQWHRSLVVEHVYILHHFSTLQWHRSLVVEHVYILYHFSTLQWHKWLNMFTFYTISPHNNGIGGWTCLHFTPFLHITMAQVTGGWTCLHFIPFLHITMAHVVEHIEILPPQNTLRA